MKQMGLAWGVLLMCCFAGRVLGGSLDILEQDLNQLKQQNDETTAQALTSFYQALDAAMGSPDAAFDLYQKANGKMPDPTPVTKRNVDETPTERADREAQDQANAAALASVVQVHCGLMRYAAVFVMTPDQKGLQDAWIAWLKSAAQTYPTLRDDIGSPPPPPPAGDDPAPNGKHHKKNGGGGGGGGINFKTVTVKDSIISKYLGFHSWGDKEQGGWAVQNIPSLYQTDVLQPLRQNPTAATLAAWDVYIAMKNADQPDTDKWNQVEYPGLLFDRDCDDYAISPSIDKLTVLLQIIRSSPNYPKLDDMIARTKKLLDDYKSAHAAPVQTVTAPAPTTDPNVSVTTTTQGDMTVITTHSNAPPVNPAPPPTQAPAPVQ